KTLQWLTLSPELYEQAMQKCVACLLFGLRVHIRSGLHFLGSCLESTTGCSEWPGPWVSRSERKGLRNGRQGCIPKYINTLDIGTLICFSRNEREGFATDAKAVC